MFLLSSGFKRNPNLPDSAYKDFDVSGVAGFDVETPPPLDADTAAHGRLDAASAQSDA